MHVLLVLGGLRLPKNSASRLTDRLDMTFTALPGAYYLEQTTTNIHHNHTHHVHVFYFALLLEGHGWDCR